MGIIYPAISFSYYIFYVIVAKVFNKQSVSFFASLYNIFCVAF